MSYEHGPRLFPKQTPNDQQGGVPWNFYPLSCRFAPIELRATTSFFWSDYLEDEDNA